MADFMNKKKGRGKRIEFDKPTPKIWQKQAKYSEINLAINKNCSLIT